ncbi:MAG: hypothetical protein AAGL90_00850 [Pseudomonadota bacterium]
MTFPSHQQRLFTVALPILLLLTGCHYGPERLKTEIENAVLNPGKNSFAVAAHVWTVRDPEGFVATFPNGGVLDEKAKTAKIFVVDLQSNTIELRAVFDETTIIPNPKTLRLLGWKDDIIYFHMEGYGGYDRRNGDHTDDPREAFYRLLSSGQMNPIQARPTELQPTHEYYSRREAPRLSLVPRFNYLEIMIGASLTAPESRAYFVIDPITGDGSLSQFPPED